jgi:hypothetical protein
MRQRRRYKSINSSAGYCAGSSSDVAKCAKEVPRLEDGQRILDGVRDQLKGLTNNVGAVDRDRIDLFTTSVPGFPEFPISCH